MRTTTEAMVKLLGRTNRKTRGFFVMEGAQTHKVCAAFFKLNILTHHIDNINAGQQVLNKSLRYQLKRPIKEQTRTNKINAAQAQP